MRNLRTRRVSRLVSKGSAVACGLSRSLTPCRTLESQVRVSSSGSDSLTGAACTGAEAAGIRPLPPAAAKGTPSLFVDPVSGGHYRVCGPRGTVIGAADTAERNDVLVVEPVAVDGVKVPELLRAPAADAVMAREVPDDSCADADVVRNPGDAATGGISVVEHR